MLHTFQFYLTKPLTSRRVALISDSCLGIVPASACLGDMLYLMDAEPPHLKGCCIVASPTIGQDWIKEDQDIRQNSRMQNRQGLDIRHYNPKGEKFDRKFAGKMMN
jgi:hypothetical protein